MVSHTWVRLVAVVGTASLLLTACSGGKDDKGKSEGDGDGDKRVTIASLLGAPDYENIDYDAQQQQIEEAIAKCMAEEGWEYIPVKYPDMGGTEYTDEDELKRIEREGLGIVYYTLTMGDEPSSDDPWANWVDPNQEYISSLSEAEQIAYNESLYGTEEEQAAVTTTQVDEETGEEYTMMSGNVGCSGEAYEAINGNDPTSDPAIQEAMSKYYEELQQRTEADPRLIELNEKWSKCMKDAGFDYEDINSYYEKVYTEFQARADKVLGPDFYKDPMEGWTQEQIDDFSATATNEDWNELYAEQQQLSPEQRTQLEEILADEIVVAKAQFNCSKDMNDKAADIYAEIEEQYAIEHEDELKALAASVSEKR